MAKMNLDAPLLQGCSAQGGKHHAAVKLLALSIWIVFLLVGGLRAELVDRIVAIVNNDIILLSELDQTLADLRVTLDKQGYSQSQKEQKLLHHHNQIDEEHLQAYLHN